MERRCFLCIFFFIFLAKTTFQAFESCSVHISQFMMQGVGIVYKM